MEFTKQPLKPFGEEILAIEVPTDLGLKTPLIFRCARLLQDNGCIDPAMRQLVELCFDEALTNAMLHGNRLNRQKKLRLRLFCDDKRWGAIIEDEGAGFALKDLPKPGVQDFTREAGRGILLMDSYLDRLLYSEKGNRVMMIRRRERGVAPAEVAQPARAAEEKEMLEFEEAAAPSARARAAAAPPPEFARATIVGDVAVIEVFETRLSDVNVDRFRKEVEKALAGCRSLVFDMARVNYISSVILSAFASFARALRPKGGAMKIAGAHPAVLAVLKASGFDKLLDPQPDRESALARLRAKS